MATKENRSKHTETEWDRDTKNMGFFSYWWYQYLLVSALYMLEPWERNLFHTILALVFGMMFYSAYIYLPYHSAILYQSLTEVTHRLWESVQTSGS